LDVLIFIVPDAVIAYCLLATNCEAQYVFEENHIKFPANLKVVEVSCVIASILLRTLVIVSSKTAVFIIFN
jgi:hypothetical protein